VPFFVNTCKTNRFFHALNQLFVETEGFANLVAVDGMMAESTLQEQLLNMTHRNILLEAAIAVGSLQVQGELHAIPWSFKS
jgi:ABC-type uncharacterized transport system permease subunit